MRALAMAIVLTSVLAHADAKHDAQTALERGVAAYRAHDLDAARASLTEASRLSPDSPNPHRWLAIVEREGGACREALVHVESFLARVPKDDARVAEMVELRNACVVVLTEEKHAPPPPAPPAEHRATRWWLWGAIGASTAIVLGVVVFLVVHEDDPLRLAPVMCGATGCE